MLLPLLLPCAGAYTLSGYAWPPDRLPVQVHWTGEQDGLTQTELQTALEGAAATWAEAGACGVGLDIVEDPEAESWFDEGGVAVQFGDPGDELGVGLYAAILTSRGSGETFTSNGATYEDAPPTQIAFNDGAVWISDDAIAAGTCVDQLSLQGYLTQAFGTVLGLADPCDTLEPCSDATMAWSLSACDSSASTLSGDDVAGLRALYGAVPVTEDTVDDAEDTADDAAKAEDSGCGDARRGALFPAGLLALLGRRRPSRAALRTFSTARLITRVPSRRS